MQDDYDKLKKLLLQDEINQLNTITRILKNLEKKQRQDILIEDLSKLITKILAKSMDANRLELYATLEPIITKGIYDELSRNDQSIQKKLFPIITSSLHQQIYNDREAMIKVFSHMMGGLIYHYLSHRMKALLLALDNQIRFMLTSEMISHDQQKKEEWIPIDALFLIHRRSSLLITHLKRYSHLNISKPLVMSKIRNYLNSLEESAQPKGDELLEIELGDLTILLETTPNCYLAMVTHSKEIKENKLSKLILKDRVEDFLEQLEQTNAQSLESFDGDTSKVDLLGIEDTLAPLLGHERSHSPRFPGYAVAFLIILLVIFMGWMGTSYYENHQKSQQLQEVRHILKSKFKVYDLKLQHLDDRVLLTGLVSKASEQQMVDALLKNYPIINRIEAIHSLSQQKKERVTAQKLLNDIELLY